MSCDVPKHRPLLYNVFTLQYMSFNLTHVFYAQHTFVRKKARHLNMVFIEYIANQKTRKIEILQSTYSHARDTMR